MKKSYCITTKPSVFHYKILETETATVMKPTNDLGDTWSDVGLSTHASICEDEMSGGYLISIDGKQLFVDYSDAEELYIVLKEKLKQTDSLPKYVKICNGE